MKTEKKIKYNLVVGILSQVVTLLLGIIVPKLILTNYGSEVNGLLSSVTNIYAYIAIVEAGIAAAACQALYKSIAQNNRNSTSAILSATNKYYHKTGFIYLGLVLAFSIIYPILINTDIPYITVVLVILFNGFGNVVNYFFHGKYLILLRADGKNYIRTGLELFTNAFKQIAKIVFISLGYDVVFVQFVAMLASFAQMAYITYYIKKHYSWINLKADPDRSAISQSKHVFVHEINYLITSNIATVLLTIFSTLKKVSVYAMYALLFDMINKVLRTVKESLEFKIAHVFHTDKNAFLKLYRTFEVYIITFSFALFTIANFFVLPFLSLYTKGVTDINYIDKYLPFLFVFINLLSAGRYPFDAMVHISGHFKQTQNSAILESVINIAISIVLIQFFGIYGALFGTIISSLYRTNYLILYVNKRIIGRSPVGTYKIWGINFIIYIFIMFVSRYIVVKLDSYIRIFAFCVPYALVVLSLYFMVVSLCEPQSFSYVLNIAKHLFKKGLVKQNTLSEENING